MRTGLERIELGEVALPAGRAGLLLHSASRTRNGTSALQVLRERGVDVVRLFGPEHGVQGQAAAGEKVASGIDPDSGLPVVSLYGASSRPRPEDLADLDLLVVDLQDAGVRFYTYVSTMLQVLEVAAETEVEIVILDRPNPLGGLRVAGPVSADRAVVAASLVNMAPGPLVHGLTLGEIALLVQQRDHPGMGLQVIPMSGWTRQQTFAATRLPWQPPSPNLRSAAAALVYPGVALLEATNVSEGRGTDSPFLHIGAPWLDAEQLSQQLAADVPGLRTHVEGFIPRSSAAAPHPKFQDETCQGLRLEVEDPLLLDPYRLGVALLLHLRHQPEFLWRDDGDALTWLVGNPDLFAAVEAGLDLEQILALDEEATRAWRKEIASVLLYD